MASTDLSDVYGEQYYAGYYERSPRWFDFFTLIADRLIEEFEPKTHLDAGCAWGLLVEVMREKGVQSFGVDFSAYALEQIHPDVKPYCHRGSLADPISGGPYDLVTCIEVLEHMEEEDAVRAIENLAAVTDVVLFSSTPDDLDDPTHINVHPVLYWLREFAKQGFFPDASSDALFLTEQAFFVRKTAEPLPDEALRMFAQLMELRAEARRLTDRLASPANGHAPSDAAAALLKEGPAWQLISRYRSWLGWLHQKSPTLLRAWEGGVRLALSPLTYDRHQEPTPWSGREYAEWIARNEPSEDDLAAQVRLANDLNYRPKFSVIMPVYQISTKILQAAIDSLQAQTYDNWELCASVIPSLNPQAAALLQTCSEKDSRIRLCALESNLGISGNSNEALKAASGEFVALLTTTIRSRPPHFMRQRRCSTRITTLTSSTPTATS